jgi:fumarylpyruvate hydrolase
MSDQKFAFPPPPVSSVAIAGSDLRFPIHRVYCVGRNYLAHIREFGKDEKAPPFFFSKTPDMVVENGSSVPYPPLTKNFHHEVELVVAIGKGGADIPVENALDHVFGYGVGFDMTRRDIQQEASKAGRPWEIGKSFDYSAPCSAIHPVAKVGHFPKGRIQISVNGQVRQNSDVSLMLWNVPEIIHHLSLQVTLQPGDLIFTGTPEGVGAVVSGDEMVGSIEGLDELRIKVA